MDLRLTFQKVVDRGPRILNKAHGAARKNYVLAFAPFNIAYPTGSGVSQAVAKYALPFTSPWTIRYPLVNHPSNLLFVVRYVEAGITKRLKLWWGIGERLAVPYYTGQVIPVGAEIEIWTVSDQPAVLADAYEIPVGLLETQTEPGDLTRTELTGTLCIVPSPATTLSALLTSCVS